tara:strand:- start:7062 stop:7559 length:498 start_codon:yes stop_codon:yes gene_type:complete
MTNESRVSKGQPTGGQFAAKTYTEDDVSLLSSAVAEADQAVWEIQRKALLLRAQYVAATVLVQHPDAATVTLVESDQEDCTWQDEYILDADGNHIAESVDLDLTTDFWEMPLRVPMVRVAGESGIESQDDPSFNWLTITHDRRRGSTATFDVRAAAAIGNAEEAW